MSRRFVAVSDLHIHPHRVCSRNNGADRLADGLSALRQTLEHARTHRCPWVFCGDIKIPRHTWAQEAQNGILEAFEEFQDVEKLMLPGNHDGEGTHGTGLRAFRRHARVIETPTVVTDWGGPPVLVWPSGAGDLVPSTFQAEIILGHAFLAGALLGPEELHAASPVTLESFGFLGGTAPRWKLGIFGDIHKGQMLVRDPHHAPRWVPFRDLKPSHWAGPWAGQVLYPGSPYQQNWGERDDGPKGCLLVEENTISLLPVTAPVFREYDYRELPDGRAFNEGLAKAAAAWRGNFVRLLLGPWGRDPRVAAVIEAARESTGPRAFQALVAPVDRTEQRADLHAGMGTRDLLKAYILARPLEGVGPRDLLRAGELLAEPAHTPEEKP